MDKEEYKKIKGKLRKELREISKLDPKKAKKIANRILKLIENGKIELTPESIKERLTKIKGRDEILGLTALQGLIERGEIKIHSRKFETTEMNKTDIIEKSDEDMDHKTQTEKYSLPKEAIGRVVLTPKSPATPTKFFFWVKDDEKIHIEPGTIVTVESPENLKIVGIVEDIVAMSEVPTTISEFYGHGYGNPDQVMSTHRPIIRECAVKVISRNDGRTEPVIRKYPVYLADREEIVNAYSSNIREEDRVLVGFTKDAENNFVPIYADFDYLFGYAGVHINISGASGLAAKTSYAIFLILSALSYSYKHKEKGLGIIAFNVKERDLLDITCFTNNFKDMKEVISFLNKDKKLSQSAFLWNATLEEGINPFEIFTDENVHILEPGKDFKYGFLDIVELGGGGPDLLRLFFDKEDLNDVFESLLYAIINEYTSSTNKHKASFRNIVKDLTDKVKKTKPNQQSVIIGGVPIHRATLGKFLRRIEVALNQLNKIIDPNKPKTNKMIKLGEYLRPGKLIVVNIEPLPDRGKRLVFLSVLKTVNYILEQKKEAGEDEDIEIGSDHYPLKDFPSRVAIFVDELNKFAPAGREYSSIKAPIIDIAARGRSIGLSLIGAQQMASQVDQEILVNSSTFVVGRSHPIEISGKAYEWLKGGLKERVTILPQGQLIMFHAIHTAPILLYFPIPLHRIPSIK